MITLGTPKRPTHPEIIDLATFTPVKPFRIAGTTTVYPLNPSTASSTNQSYVLPSCFTWGIMNWSRATISPAAIGTGISLRRTDRSRIGCLCAWQTRHSAVNRLIKSLSRRPLGPHR